MYNVFKRPMFKRGGPTKGTGIMSHVEPRRNYNLGAYGLVSQGMAYEAQARPNPPQTSFQKGNLARQNLISAMQKYGTRGIDLLRGAGGRTAGFFGLDKLRIPPSVATSTTGGVGITAALPLSVAGLSLYANKPKTQAELDFAREFGALDETMSPDQLTEYYKERERLSKVGPEIGFFDMFKKPDEEAAGEKKRFLSRLEAQRKMQEDKKTTEVVNNALNKDPGEKTETTYKEADNRSRIQKEADEILGVIQDKDLDRAEAALLVSKALKQGGSLSDKIDYALKDASGIIKRKGQERQAAKLLAYKTVKEEDIAKIKAGELPGISKVINRLAELQATDPAKLSPTQLKEMQGLESYLEKDNYLEKLQQKAYYDYYITNKQRIPSLEAQIAELSKGKKLNVEDAKALADAQKELELLKTLEQLTGFGSLKLKKGGRVNYANGTQMESELESQNIEGASNEFPTKTVEKLSFAELRNRLPKEITDDVVSLIATSEEALQDFAYIRTQQDINNFNVKYGVNLILPPAKG